MLATRIANLVTNHLCNRMKKKITVDKTQSANDSLSLLANKSSSNKQTKKIIMSAMRYTLTYASGTPI